MNERPTLKIDGRSYPFEDGDTVFSVARRNGVFIPSLCQDDRLAPGGHCRLCLVEVEGRPRPMTSCTQRAEAGLDVTTRSDTLDAIQKPLLQLVLSENPDGECPHCRDLGPCELHALADRFGVKRDRFLGRLSNASRKDDNPFLIRDYDRCISCYRCTRICAEIEGDYAITAAGRGFDTRITTAFDGELLESSCTLCGQCIYTCPTGALRNRKMEGVGQATEKTKSICTYCGTGCSLVLHAKDGKLIGVTPDLDGPVNQGAMCVKGQFGFDFVTSDRRLTSPLIRENGSFREASWDEALDLVASRFEELRDRHGAKSVYAIASGRAPNESSYTLQKLMRAIMGSNQVDNCSRA